MNLKFDLESLTYHFISHPSYLSKGLPSVAKMLNIPEEMVAEAKQKALDLINEGWDVKAQWIKSKSNSTFLIKKPSTEDYKQDFSDFLNTFQPSKNEPPALEYMTSALLVYMSDKHIGAKTKEDSLLPNEWNLEVFTKRMTILAEKIVDMHNSRSFDSIVLIDLGDSVDGFNGQTTRGGHSLPQNMTNREVYLAFMDVHLNFIESIQKYCKTNISYITIGDSNHGGDFEWICNRSLQTAVELKYPDIDFYTGNKFIEHFIINEHCFILCHGKDSEDMKFPLPLNLNDKVELYFKNYIDAHCIKSKFIHVIKGDLHRASTDYGQFFRYKNVLSMYGSSKWIQTNFMKNTSGVCMDVLFNNNQGIEEHYLFF